MVEKTLAFAKEKLNGNKKIDKTKKKKEDPVKERKIISLVLTASIFLSVFFYLTAHWPNLRLDLSLPSLPRSLPRIIAPSAPLESKIDNIVLGRLGEQKNNWAVWIEDLNSGFIWSYQEKEIFPSDSLAKLGAAATLYQQAEAGEISLSSKVILTQEDFQGGSGNLKDSPVGSEISLNAAAMLCLSQSDNTSFNLITRFLSEQLISRNIFSQGMINTSLENKTTTAADLALFFQKLYRNQLLSPEFKEEMLNNLAEGAFADYLPKNLPQGIKTAHQVSEGLNSLSDAGIVFVPQKPILLIFLAKNIPPDQAKVIIADLSKDVYWFLVAPR
ncbi:MAG: serine hydrolase [Candidatus Shapirobacteria bacterium]